MAFGELFQGDTIKFLELLNESLAARAQFLETQLLREQELNQALLRKLGILEYIRVEINTGELEPIGGFKTLRQKIKEAEEKSRKEFFEEQENAG